MTRSAVRWTIFGLFVAVLTGAAYLMWTNASASRSVSVSTDNFDRRAAALTRGILELRMAQQSYVAAGQGDEFWGSKVAAQIASVRDELGAIRGMTSNAQAHAQIDEATSALGDFERMDARAREYTRGNQRLLASDLIFSDGLEKTDAMLDALQGARTAELAASQAFVSAARRRELLLVAGSAAAALLFGLLLVPVPARARPGDAPVATAAAPPAAEHDGLILHDARDPAPPLPT